MMKTYYKISLFEHQDNLQCQNYLKKRSLSDSTIKDFRIGYSYNSNNTLYEFLKDQGFQDEHILKSNVVKKDNKRRRVAFAMKS